MTCFNSISAVEILVRARQLGRAARSDLRGAGLGRQLIDVQFTVDAVELQS